MTFAQTFRANVRARVVAWARGVQINQFVLAHWPPAKEWKRRTLEAWLRWHFHHGFLSLALNDNNSIAGLVIARPVMVPPSRHDWYTFDDEGPCLFVDLVISAQPHALKGLGFAILQRFGMREKVAWRPDIKSDAVRIYPARAIRRNLLRYVLGQTRYE